MSRCAENLSLWRILRRCLQRIARASSAGGIFDQDTVLDEINNVPVRCVLGALGELRPFGRGQLPLKGTIQQFVQHVALPLVERQMGMRFPELVCSKHGR